MPPARKPILCYVTDRRALQGAQDQSAGCSERPETLLLEAIHPLPSLRASTGFKFVKKILRGVRQPNWTASRLRIHEEPSREFS